MKRELTGQVVRALVGRDAASLVTTRETTVTITMEGVAGDKHAGITRLSDSRTPCAARHGDSQQPPGLARRGGGVGAARSDNGSSLATGRG